MRASVSRLAKSLSRQAVPDGRLGRCRMRLRLQFGRSKAPLNIRRSSDPYPVLQSIIENAI